MLIIKLKVTVLMSESFNWFIQVADSLGNKASVWISLDT